MSCTRKLIRVPTNKTVIAGSSDMNTPLPVGTYILNNGPRRKGHGGRFTMGTHRMLKQLMKDVPGVTFTEKPDKADFVILPEGVKEPGRKLTQRNPSLKDPRRVFSMDQITHVMHSEAYHHYKYGLMYTAKDAQGRPVQIDVPVNLEPSDQAFMQTIAKVSNVDLMVIPDTDYTVVRRNLRGAPQPVVVPNPPPGQQPPPPQQQNPVSAAPTHNLWSKIAQVDTLLGALGSVPPLEPAPALPVAAQQQLAQLQAQQLREQQQLARLQTQQLQEQQQWKQLQAQSVPTPTIAAADIERLKAEGRQSLANLAPTGPTPLAPTLQRPPAAVPRPMAAAAAASEPLPTSLLGGVQPAGSAAAPGAISSSQLQVDLAQVQEAYTKLARNTSYESTDLESMFRQDEPRTSRHVLGLVQQMEKFRMALQAVLYTLAPANISEYHQLAETVARQKLESVNTALPFLREYLAGPLLTTLTTLQVNDPSAVLLHRETVIRALVEALAYLKRFITLLSQSNTTYREVILKHIRASQGGLDCKKSNLFCTDKGEPVDLRAVIWSLFNSACQLMQTPSDQFATKIDFQALCQQNEMVHATLCDIYNILYLKGFYSGRPPEGATPLQPTSGRICQDFYTTIQQTLRAYDQLTDGQTGVDILDVLRTLQVASDAHQLWLVGSKPTIYNYFYRFLVKLDPETNQPTATTRDQALSEMQSQINSKLSVANRQRIYLEMTMAALFFQLANFCSGHKGWFGSGIGAAGTGDFTLEHIQTWLKRDYTQSG